MARLLIFAVIGSACATTAVDLSLPAGVEKWPTVTKLAYLPLRLSIDVDGVPITPDSMAKVQPVAQQLLERVVKSENLDTGTFLALTEPWQQSADKLAHWLEASPCPGSSAPVAAHLATLLPPIRADAAVFIDIHAHLTRDGITGGHTLLGKFAGTVGVATLVTVTALRGAADGDPYLELGVESSAVHLAARDLASRRFGPLCADHVDVGLRDSPDVRLLGEASVTVAVVTADNQLLWFRRGKLPLVFGDPTRAAQVIAALVRAGN